ncbi:hypothetical protein GCK72_025609 [Caenorhabditis remanei]|uniref:BTB domain-containing protein n=1 Tax=Caenorhabditis remanei TaxID=31234 RepID=A0A6A5G364_CAERE|nr:hypothetical protein GCK72_025609 [Caenorhabditis remanei]KAF1749142.1 hypothetical protein GCK72_025609 [Caenorhabditis remanei]
MADNHGPNQPNGEGSISTSAPAKRPLRRDLGHVSSCSTRITQKNFENHWSIENFTAQQGLLMPEEHIMAPSFGDNEYEFSMKLFPNGKDLEHKDYVSLFLHVHKCPNPRLRFQVSFTINTSQGTRTCTLNRNMVTINRTGVITASKFFMTKTINDARNLYTPNDTLTLGCEITVYGEILTRTTSVFDSYARKKKRLEKLGLLSDTGDDSSTGKPEEAPNGDRFPSLLDSGDFSDFTVVASCGREFHTHMCILSSRSDYFNALLRNKTTREFIEKRVKFDDISATTLEVVLRHIYNTSNEVKIEDDQLTSDLAAAIDRLMVPSMLTQIREILTQNLSVDNVVTRITMAAELRMEDEYYFLLEYFSTIKKEAMESTLWLVLKKEKPQMTVKILEDAMMLDESSRQAVQRNVDLVITLE